FDTSARASDRYRAERRRCPSTPARYEPRARSLGDPVSGSAFARLVRAEEVDLEPAAVATMDADEVLDRTTVVDSRDSGQDQNRRRALLDRAPERAPAKPARLVGRGREKGAGGALGHLAVQPPSIKIVSPVISDAA